MKIGHGEVSHVFVRNIMIQQPSFVVIAPNRLFHFRENDSIVYFAYTASKECGRLRYSPCIIHIRTLIFISIAVAIPIVAIPIVSTIFTQ